MSLRLRPALGQIPAYKPGRSPRDIAEAAGLAEPVRLASNELAEGPLPSVTARLLAGIDGLNRYPDFSKRELVATVASTFDVAPEGVTASAGSVALLQHLVQATSGQGTELLIGWRSFEAYKTFGVASGADVVTVPLADQTHDLKAMAAAVTPQTSLVIVCNPNNPTGTVVDDAAVARFVDAVPDDVVVVFDEAYIEFCQRDDVHSALPYVRSRPNVAVLRTFSKAYGLAGLRVGFCLSSPELAEAIRKVQTPFGVNALAEAAAVASLGEEAGKELTRRVTDVCLERQRVVAELAALGIEVPPSAANFVFVPLGEESAGFAEACERHGVLVRAYQPDGVRVTTGLPAENDRFLAAAADWARARS